MKTLKILGILSLWFIGGLLVPTKVQAADIGAACTGEFVNPMSRICWDCMFPLTIARVPIWPSKYPDTTNPSLPISFCPKPPPIFMQVGLNIGYWEPYAMVDVTRVPYCMVNMGMKISTGNTQQVGGQTTVKPHDANSNGAFYHAHWYKYPLIYWLQIIQSSACMALDNFDISYLTEYAPYWDDD
ncbi:TraU family protein, partial [Aliivibrio fischeri]